MKVLTAEQLSAFEPFTGLQDNRVVELAKYCVVEDFAAGEDPFRLRPPTGQSVYLLAGQLEFSTPTGKPVLLSAGEPKALRPLELTSAAGQSYAVRAVTPVALTRIDNDLLDIMVTWDQIAGDSQPLSDASRGQPVVRDYEEAGWHLLSGVFSVQSLTTGTFASLPSAHIGQLLDRFEPVSVARGEVIIKEGDEGDYYYVISTGRAQVTRKIGGVSMPLADFKSGAAFGEEALIADTKRNATVTMLTNGTLLRLAKRDFVELLQKPLLTEVEIAEAKRRIGAVWVDVRFPSEFQHDKMPEAINIPLGELRHAFAGLDKSVEYIVYCQSGRRSGAAAFLLAQRGFRAMVLAGGLQRVRGAAP